MTPEEYRKDFLEGVRALAAVDKNFERAAFVDSAVQHLGEADEISDFEACHFRGVGAKKRALWVDGFAFDDADYSVRLLVADWHGEETTTVLTQTEAANLLNRVRSFVEESTSGSLHTRLEESTPEYSLASELYRRNDTVTRYRIYLVTDSVLSSRVKDWPEGTIGGAPVEFHIWDINRFHRVHESRTGRDELEIDFTKYLKDGIPALAASLDVNRYKAFLCIIPGKVLAELYEEYGSRLLEGNVRSFLTVKGKVNKGIRSTILGEPDMFFPYNNGIAATASDVGVRNGSGGLHLISANDLQIVNGGQTTASLALALRREKANLDRVFVQMKLSVIPSEKSGEVIPLIARYANNQNKVNEADFFSNHEYHRRIEEISHRIYAPAKTGAQHETHWFYERARGQYLNEQASLTPAAKAKFVAQNPREQLITKTDLAKAENSWRRLPHIVSRGAQKNFINFAEWVGGRWDNFNEEYNEAYFKNVVAHTIIFRAAERLVSKQSWYQGGYRANVVTYAVAKLSVMLVSAGKELPYASIWTRQALSAALEAQIVDVAKRVFEVIINPMQGFQNVTEWCKKENCWQAVEGLDIPMSKPVIAELVDPAVNRGMRVEARKQQKNDDGISAQVQVVNLGRNFWVSLSSWGKQKNLLSNEQVKLVIVAQRMPSILPNEFQSAKLLEIKAMMESEGFRPQ
jgi:hypothetical protein